MNSNLSKTGFVRPKPLWALSGFPACILAACLAALWFSLLSIDRFFDLDLSLGDTQRAVSTGILTLLATAAAGFTTLAARPWVRWAVQGAIFLCTAIIGCRFSFEDLRDLTLALALICFISLAAGAGRRKSLSHFWLINAGLLLNLALALAALAIVLAGTKIILSAIEALLGIETSLLLDVLWSVAFWLAFPWFWLSLAGCVGAGSGEEGEQPDDLVLRVIAVATGGLLIPLMLVFGAVIHIYAARTVVLRELPEGQIGWVVPTYLLIGYGVFLLSAGPLVLLPRIRAMFHRVWVGSTVIPLALLGFAAFIRVRAYGVTEERYLLFLVTLGGALLVALALLRRPFDLRFVPLTAGVLALVASVGPFNAVDVSIRSQTARASAILTSVPPERWAVSKDGGLSEEQKRTLAAAIQYLRQHTSAYPESLASVWPPHLQKDGWLTEEELALMELEPEDFMSLAFTKSHVIQLQTITILNEVDLDFNKQEPRTFRSGSSSFTLSYKEPFLDIASENVTTRFDLSPLLRIEKDSPSPLDFILHSVEGRKGDLIMSRFERSEGPTGPVLRTMSATIVLQ